MTRMSQGTSPHYLSSDPVDQESAQPISCKMRSLDYRNRHPARLPVEDSKGILEFLQFKEDGIPMSMASHHSFQ